MLCPVDTDKIIFLSRKVVLLQTDHNAMLCPANNDQFIHLSWTDAICTVLMVTDDSAMLYPPK